VKARKVQDLDLEAGLADNAERIVRVRLAELYAFVPAALDVAEVEALHDMRIAAKRLRYVLEVTAAPCFGPYARTAAKRTRDLQDLIGEIHDCDVGLPRVRAAAEARLRADADALLARAGDDARDVAPEAAAGLPHAAEHRGLATLQAYLEGRRAVLYARFLELWHALGREGFRARLEFALAERPGSFTADSPDDNVGVTRRS
jgi:CHAD domain-containing protein